jgi:hypothetical protein
MSQSCDMGQTALLPLEGRHAEDFFARKIRRIRPGLNPRTWVPEASILTTRLPKPLGMGLAATGLDVSANCNDYKPGVGLSSIPVTLTGVQGLDLPSPISRTVCFLQ